MFCMIYVWVYIYDVHMCVHMCVYMYMLMFMFVYIWWFTCICVYVCRLYIGVCVYVYVIICMSVCSFDVYVTYFQKGNRSLHPIVEASVISQQSIDLKPPRGPEKMVRSIKCCYVSIKTSIQILSTHIKCLLHVRTYPQ